MSNEVNVGIRAAINNRPDLASKRLWANLRKCIPGVVDRVRWLRKPVAEWHDFAVDAKALEAIPQDRELFGGPRVGSVIASKENYESVRAELLVLLRCL